MSEHPEDRIPFIPEVDQHGGDELPSYADLAAQHGPNSRFGRWRSWIEKRAAERYADLTPEDLARRKQKGWGEGPRPLQLQDQTTQPGYPGPASSHAPQLRLHIQTNLSEPITPPGPPPESIEPLPLIGEVISPSHLKLHHFGSRFLPHTTAPIRCLLPLLGDSLLLIGTDDGLSVLNMFPKEWTDHGLMEKGPNDAEVHHIWIGEGVFQMTLLEADSTGDGMPQGVVLALVGPTGDSPKDQEGIRTIRMYNLTSLVSLAKWAVVQQPGTLPLHMNDLPSGKPSLGRQHHKQKSNITKGFRNMKLDPLTPQSTREPFPSFPPGGVPPAKYYGLNRGKVPDSPATLDSSWDVVEDLPIRWATDYVSLAAQGTRLYNTPVLFYDMWRDSNERNRGLTYLAVVVKNNILLYQAPKGERAFRFVKDFYTPLTARSVTFIQQSVQDMTRSPSDVTPRHRGHSSHLLRHAKGMSMSNGTPIYPAQLGLFVIFEKKAGLIRIIDSAVAEVELFDDGSSGFASGLLSPSGSNISLGRRNRSSWDGKGFVKESKAPWAPPHKVDLPSTTGRASFSQSMYLLTRGKQSQVLPYPLPANLANIPPYRSLYWSFTPSYVSTRVCRPSDGSPAFLQFIAFGEEGVEIQEITLSSLSEVKGKGRAEEPVRAVTDVGGLDCGFLVTGGHWDGSFWDLGQSPSVGCDSTESEEDLSSDEMVDSYHATEGVYGWTRKGTEDWRIFWLGGCSGDNQDND